MANEVKKCCANCRWYVVDYSTDASWCAKDDGEWVKTESDDYWAVDYDYCTNYKEADYEDTDV